MKQQISDAQLKRRREIRPHWLWYIPLGYVLIVAFLQGSFEKFGSTYKQILVLLLAVSIATAVIEYTARKPSRGAAILLALSIAAGFFFSDSHRYGWAVLWDVAAFVGGVTAVVAARRFVPPRWHARWHEYAGEKWHGLSFIAMVVAGWAVLSAVSTLRDRPLPTDPNRFAQIAAGSLIPEQTQRWARKRIGLALSGGGYRAALFHAGTLHALETLGLRPSVLSTVSGGSIIGAYYAVGGDPVEFKNAVIAGRFNLMRELLLLHNAARLPFPMHVPKLDVTLAPIYSFSRGDAQAHLLRSALFDDTASWRTQNGLQPRQIIATTELTYGMQVGLMPDGIVAWSVDGDREVYRGRRFIPSTEYDLAKRVAVSGAFPVAFPIEKLDVKVIPCGASGEGTRSLQLADGGIVDNTGLELLQTVQSFVGAGSDCELPSDDWAVDLIIVSNAGALFGLAEDLSLVGGLARAFDIVSVKARARPNTDGERPIFIDLGTRQTPTSLRFALDNDQPISDDDPRNWHGRFDPRDGYSPDLLRAVFAPFQGSRGEAARVEVEAYLRTIEGTPALDAEARRRWSFNLPRVGSRDECRKRRDTDSAANELKELPGICEAAELREMFRAELTELAAAFQRTSTLNDWPPKADAEKVYALGQLLTYGQWITIRRSLDQASQ